MKLINMYNTLLAFALFACQEEIDLDDVSKFQKKLVINAEISNSTKNSYVKLTHTIPFQATRSVPIVEDASVLLLNRKEKFPLDYRGKGIYKFAQNNLTIQPEENYILIVETSLGKFIGTATTPAKVDIRNINYTWTKSEVLRSFILDLSIDYVPSQLTHYLYVSVNNSTLTKKSPFTMVTHQKQEIGKVQKIRFSYIISPIEKIESKDKQVLVTLHSVSKDAYDYRKNIRKLIDEDRVSFSLSQTILADPPNNYKKALGYFSIEMQDQSTTSLQ